MSQRPRKPLVLIFILGAIALGVLMIYSFGGRNIFTRHEQFLLYFDDTVNGLAPGSLVKFKGVRVGKVDSIRLRFHTANSDHRIPVLIRLNADLLQRQLGVLEDLSDPVVLAAEIHRGLRGELTRESFVTGGVFVSLDYHPQATAPKAEPDSGNFAVIPTFPSSWVADIQRVDKFFAWLPTYDFEAKAGQIDDYLDKISLVVSAIPYAEYHQKVIDTLRPLADFNMQNWQRNLNYTLSRFDNGQMAMATASQRYAAASQDFVSMNTATRQYSAQVNDSLAAFRIQLNPTAPWADNVTQTLGKISSQLQNLTDKADNLEEQPAIFPKLAQ